MRLFTAAGGAVLALSVCLHFLQARKINSLEQRLEANESVNSAIIGLDAAEIAARDTDGRVVKLRLTGTDKPTVLYVFRPSCPWCSENSNAFASLVASVAGKYNVVGLSLDREGLVPYVKQHGMSSIPIYTDPEPSQLQKYQLGHTPETIIVSRQGVIVQDWRGAYVGGISKVVQGFFGVSLPMIASF